MYSKPFNSNYPHYKETTKNDMESYDLYELVHWYKEIGFSNELLSLLSNVPLDRVNDFLDDPKNDNSNDLFALTNVLTMLIGFFNVESLTENIYQSLQDFYNIDEQTIKNYCGKSRNELLDTARNIDENISSDSIAFFKLILLFTQLHLLN